MESNESIYDIVESRKKEPKKKMRCRNQLDPNYVDETIKVNKLPCATMGRAEEPPPNPSKYLRKNANLNNKQKDQVFEKQCLKHMKLPPLPQPHASEKKIPKDIDFIKRNILSIKSIKQKECEQKLVITRKGDTVNGKKLEPTHIYSKSFGTVPSYIFDKIRCLENEAQRNIDRENLETKIPSCSYVTRIEREKLLNGLKQNWADLSKEYQLLPIITDSIPRQLHKIAVETKLDNIEKDILLVEKSPYIYVKA